MTALNSGLFIPRSARIFFASQNFNNLPVECVISHLETHAGSTPGMAVLRFANQPADNVSRQMGSRARVDINGMTIFRGIVLTAPITVNVDADEIELMLIDEKRMLSNNVIGQVDIGTVTDHGFTDVGFDIIFNKESMPNKGTAYDFDVSSLAAYWTLRDILQFVFDNYIDPTLMTLSGAEVAHAAWDATPHDLTLIGQTPAQALDTLSELAGETWAAIVNDTSMAYRSVRPGNGTVRRISLFRPWSNAKADSASEDSTNDLRVEVTIQNAKDMFNVHSAPIVLESVYSKENSLLTRNSTFADKEYQCRFGVNRGFYAANGLGADRSALAAPKPWLTTLLTRMKSDMSGYLTASEIAADPTLLRNARVEIPVWISTTGDLADAKLCLDGYRLDAKDCTIDFKTKVHVLPETGTDPESVDIEDFDLLGIWATVATILEFPETYVTAGGSAYLADHIHQLIQLTQLTPERRFNAWLPDLAGNNNSISTIAASAEEKYLDVSTQLKAAGDSALAETAQIETPIEAKLPFFPIWELGDQVAIVGRNLGATGNEVIVDLTYSVHEQFVTTIRATNVMKRVNQSKLVGMRK